MNFLVEALSRFANREIREALDLAYVSMGHAAISANVMKVHLHRAITSTSHLCVELCPALINTSGALRRCMPDDYMPG